MPPDNNLPPELQIRVATPADEFTVAATLGSAFTFDPVFNWFLPEPDFYKEMYLDEARALYTQHGHVFINEAGNGAAMWLPPGVSTNAPFRFSTLVMIWHMFRLGGFKSLGRGTKLMEIMADAHLEEPHYYLHAIGAHLDYQGRGIGSALLKHGVTLCDENNAPAYLESSNIKNNPLYERFGFEVTGEVSLPDDGPTLWFMHRPARPGG